MTDGELLQQYRAKDCEASFREIVQRHLGLVRGVAGRTLTDAPDAGALDDAAMRVFAIVAHKAESLAPRASLAGWLVVATRQETLRFARNERTSRAAMISYTRENTPAATLTGDPAWAEALPHLDAALAHLGTTDREAVMMRFYEDRGFREIGQQLGRGEDAARKRVGAALEKMGAFLRRRGVTLPASALGSLLVSHLPTASAAEAARISAGALASAHAGKAWTLASALHTHPVAAIFIALLTVTAATGGGFALGSSTAVVVPPSTTAASTKDAALAPASDASRGSPSVNSAASMSAEQLAAELVRRRRHGQQPGAPTYQQLLEEIRPEQVPSIVAALDATHRADFHLHGSIVTDVFGLWAAAEPRAAGEAAVQRWKAGLVETWQLRGLLWEVMHTWGKTDAREAVAWLEAQHLPAATAASLVEPAFDAMVAADPAAAVDALVNLPWEDRRACLRDVDVPQDPALRATLLETLAAVSDEEIRAEIFIHTLGRRSGLSREEFQRLRFTRSDAGWSAMSTLADRMSEADGSARRALDYLWQEAPEEARPAILRLHFTEFRRKEARAASEWMQQRGLTDASVEALLR